MGGDGGARNGAGDVPRDAHVVMSVLKSMGVEETDDRVVQQLLEFMHRYVGEVLDDACAYAEHRGSTARELELEDVNLAVQTRVKFGFSQPPPREQQLEFSAARNRVVLPTPPPAAANGVVLPPGGEGTLLSPNYQLRPDGGGGGAGAGP